MWPAVMRRASLKSSRTLLVGADKARHFGGDARGRAEPAQQGETADRDKVLVIGGSGFVGSAVCQAAVELGAPHVISLSRSGLTPGLKQLGHSWVDKVEWSKGDVFKLEQWQHILSSASAVVSCVGAFGSREFMKRVNGEANILAAKAAAEAGVERFVFISAHDFGVIGKVIPPGYYEGKRAAEAAILEYFPHTGVILYPGMIHGPRIIGKYIIPLQLVGAPLQMGLTMVPWLERLPVLGPAMVPPVPVAAVGRCASKAALNLIGDKQKLSVQDILKLGIA